MTPYKLTEDRIEQPAWEPPVLTFVIERHGGTAQGSLRADLQTWIVDLDAGTAKPATTGRRQLRPMSPRLDVRAIAADLTKAIASGASDPRLEWKNATTVRVRISTVIRTAAPSRRSPAGANGSGSHSNHN